MTFRVRLLASAQEDAAALYERITEAAPMRGQIWYNRLITTIGSLEHSPRRDALTPENDSFRSTFGNCCLAGSLMSTGWGSPSSATRSSFCEFVYHSNRFDGFFLKAISTEGSSLNLHWWATSAAPQAVFSRRASAMPANASSWRILSCWARAISRMARKR